MGMDEVMFQFVVGVYGEWMGLMMICVYYEVCGDFKWMKVIVFDFVYGMNFVLVIVVGFEMVMVKLNENGFVDLEDLKRVVNEEIVVFMLMNLNMFGLFEEQIIEMVEIVY